MPIYYSADYCRSEFEFDTTRKAKWVADSLVARPIAGASLRAPPMLTEDLLSDVHAPEYIRAVRTGEPRGLAESQGFDWDAGLWSSVLASSSGAAAAGLMAMRHGVAGSLSSGLHHAMSYRGAGFCTFNGLALAAKAALSCGAGRILILDLDAHCGGGTYSIIKDDDRIACLDISVSGFDEYKPEGDSTLTLVSRADEYLRVIGGLLPDEPARFDLCLYNAGMDPHENCDVGGLPGITTEILAARERIVFDWARVTKTPIAFVLAGGYVGSKLSQSELVHLHRLTINAAAGQPAEETTCAS